MRLKAGRNWSPHSTIMWASSTTRPRKRAVACCVREQLIGPGLDKCLGAQEQDVDLVVPHSSTHAASLFVADGRVELLGVQVECASVLVQPVCRVDLILHECEEG